MNYEAICKDRNVKYITSNYQIYNKQLYKILEILGYKKDTWQGREINAPLIITSNNTIEEETIRLTTAIKEIPQWVKYCLKATLTEEPKYQDIIK